MNRKNWNHCISFKLAYTSLNLFQSPHLLLVDFKFLWTLSFVHTFCSWCFLFCCFPSFWLQVYITDWLNKTSNIFERLNNESDDHDSPARAKTFYSHKHNISCGYSLKKYILFSWLEVLVFSAYLNTNKKKQFFQIQILLPAKIIPHENTEIWPFAKINPRHVVDFGISKKKSTRKFMFRKLISANINLVQLVECLCGKDNKQLMMLRLIKFSKIL